MNHKNTILFDLDGPLLDNRKKHYAVYASIITINGGKPLPLSYYWSLKQKKEPFLNLLKRSKSKLESDEFLSQFISMIESKTFLAYDQLQPSAITTLKELKKRGYELWLITSRNNRQTLIWQLNRLKLSPYFTQIISPQAPLAKVVPKSTLLSQYPKPNTLIGVVGDTEADEILAKDLNVPFYAITTGIRKKTLLHADNYLKNLSQALVHFPLSI